MNMLALPYITEGTGFAGTVYATEPTLQIGRLVEIMNDIGKYFIIQTNKIVDFSSRNW